jgi:hypothetical protein
MSAIEVLTKAARMVSCHHHQYSLNAALEVLYTMAPVRCDSNPALKLKDPLADEILTIRGDTDFARNGRNASAMILFRLSSNQHLETKTTY